MALNPHGQEHQQQQQHQQQQNGQNGSNGYPQYTTHANTVNGVSNDDLNFSTYFNVPGGSIGGEDATIIPPQKQTAINPTTTTPSWNTSAIDPRLQQNAAFSQHQQQPQSSAWSPNAFQQRTATPDISAAFRSNGSSFYPEGSFNENPYSNMAYYQQNIGYNPAAFLPQQYYGYSNGIPGHAPSIGQTISPSALQGYPSATNQQARQGNQQSHATTPANIPYYGNSNQLRTYDDTVSNQFVNALPAGINKAKGLVKKNDALESATNSKAIGKFLFLGNESFESEPITGISGKTEVRKSLNSMKRKIEEQQGGRSWENAQLPILKRVKFSHRTIKPLNLATGSTAQVELPSSGEDSSSEEDSEYESDEDVEEASPLPAVRSSEAVKAMDYDVIKTVWFKRSKHLGGNTIREALGAYWTLLKPTRDNWKTEIASMNDATAKNDQQAADRHKAAAAKYRTILNAAFRAAVKHGHNDIVGKFSENVNLFLSFYQILVDRFKESDIESETVTNILSLMARCTSTTAALLEKTKLDKILPRLAKKGSTAVKDMLKKVDDTVKANADINAVGGVRLEEVKTNGTNPEKTSVGPAGPSKSTLLNKPKIAMTSLNSKSAAAVSTSRPSTSSTKFVNGTNRTSATKPDSKKQDVRAPVEPVKTKPAAPVKTPSLFAGLQSASKRPGTSNAAQKTAVTVEKKEVKPVETKKQPVTAPLPTKSFSFADAIASIGQTKEASSKKKVEDDKPLETEEQKQKRERKEQRRALRVRWKPEALLVETRYFTHDPDEEMGHNSNMLRDAADSKTEGQMLKLHKGLKIDEEDDLPEEFELAPWHPLSLIDFSDLPEDAKADNYEAYGGSKKPASPETDVQNQRERSTLIAIYTSVTDIPFSPKEPLDPYSGPIEPMVDFGWSEDDKFKEIRRRESVYLSSLQPVISQQATSAAANIQSILSILQQGQQGQQVQPLPFQGLVGFPGQALPPPPPPPPPVMLQPTNAQPGSLEWIMSQISKSNQGLPAAVPPPLPPPPPPAIAAGANGPLNPAILHALSAFQNMQHPQPQQALFPPPQQTAPLPPPPPPQQQTTDLSAILAQISAAQSQQQPTHDNDRKRSYNDDQYGENKRMKADRGKQVGQY